MLRLTLLTAITTCTAVAAFAATEALMTENTTVIDIEVAPEDLARCEMTLQQVAGMPVVTDSGSPMLVDESADLPSVRCVATEA
ncbi:hypothetical protein [Salipiger marinus]|uniref:hypothetical protein n=1 Tax=Salipiger marinus TaxID=555512 RepID=UPI0040590821